MLGLKVCVTHYLILRPRICQVAQVSLALSSSVLHQPPESSYHSCDLRSACQSCRESKVKLAWAQACNPHTWTVTGQCGAGLTPVLEAEADHLRERDPVSKGIEGSWPTWASEASMS